MTWRLGGERSLDGAGPHGPKTGALHFVSLLRWPVVCWVIVFWRLGYPSLLDPDEAHYAELTREMVRGHNWLVPLLDGAPYIDKPILFHWLQAAFVKALGESEWAMRLPTALAALALFWITHWVGGRLFGRRVGDWGATMFATIPATFLLASVGVFDMLFGVCLFGGLSCLLVAALHGRDRLHSAGWLLLTLAVMTKGPVALILMFLFFVTSHFVGGESRRVVESLRWPAGLLFVAAAASPWFMWMWGRFGEEFVRGYVLAGNVWYLTAPLSFTTRRSSYAFYLRTFSTAFFPWSLVTIAYAADLTRRGWRRQGLPAGESLLWIWMSVVVVFFTVAGFKLDTYIFPAAPACCLLAAQGWRRATDDASQRWTRAGIVVVSVLFLVMGGTAGVVLFRLDLGIDWTAMALPLSLIIGGGCLLWMGRRHGWQPPDPLKVPLLTLLAVYASMVIVGFPVLERSRPTAPVGRWLRQQDDGRIKIGSYGLGEWRASLRYYIDRYVAELSTSDAVQAFLGDDTHGYVIMLRRDYDAFREQGLLLKVVYSRPMIAGRTGRYVKRQVWDDLVVVADRSSPLTDASP